jgi:hypothetical protein
VEENSTTAQPKSGRVSVFVLMPSEVKEPLVQRVRERNSNMNDEACAIIAANYKLPFNPTGRVGHPSSREGGVVLRLDPAVKLAAQYDALGNPPANLSHQIVRVLAREFGVEVPGPQRHRSPFGGGPRRASVARLP